MLDVTNADMAEAQAGLRRLEADIVQPFNPGKGPAAAVEVTESARACRYCSSQQVL